MGATNSKGERVHDNIARFDTDSAKIGIDNRCSACISHCIDDFEGPVRRVNRAIKGFGGERVMEVFQGTIVWKWCDNNGMVHRFKIPNSYYVPEGKVRLLSPQHWARTQIGSSVKEREGTGEKTLAHKTILFWGNGRYQLDVYLGAQDNVATFYLAPGFKKFGLYCQECKIDYDATMDDPLIADATTAVSDDEDDGDDDVTAEPPKQQRLPLWSRITGLPIGRQQAQREASTPTHTPTQSDFNLNGPATGNRPKPVVIEEEEDRQPTTDASLLLRYHHKFGHIFIRETPQHGQTKHHSEKTGELSGACLQLMHVCQSNKATMAKQTAQGFLQHTSGNKTRRSGVSGSTGVTHTRTCCATYRKAYHQEIQIRDSVR